MREPEPVGGGVDRAVFARKQRDEHALLRFDRLLRGSRADDAHILFHDVSALPRLIPRLGQEHLFPDANVERFRLDGHKDFGRGLLRREAKRLLDEIARLVARRIRDRIEALLFGDERVVRGSHFFAVRIGEHNFARRLAVHRVEAGERGKRIRPPHKSGRRDASRDFLPEGEDGRLRIGNFRSVQGRIEGVEDHIRGRTRTVLLGAEGEFDLPAREALPFLAVADRFAPVEVHDAELIALLTGDPDRLVFIVVVQDDGTVARLHFVKILTRGSVHRFVRRAVEADVILVVEAPRPLRIDGAVVAVLIAAGLQLGGLRRERRGEPLRGLDLDEKIVVFILRIRDLHVKFVEVGIAARRRKGRERKEDIVGAIRGNIHHVGKFHPAVGGRGRELHAVHLPCFEPEVVRVLRVFRNGTCRIELLAVEHIVGYGDVRLNGNALGQRKQCGGRTLGGGRDVLCRNARERRSRSACRQHPRDQQEG